MIKIYIDKGHLVISDLTNELFSWRNRAFFNISLGFVIDEQESRYVLSESDLFYDAVNEAHVYLSDLGLPFETDLNVNEILATSIAHRTEFEEVKQDLLSQQVLIPSNSFKRILKPYQVDGLKHLIKIRHGANFSVPGSGKTTMVYAYFDWLVKEGIVDKIFVVGPFSSFSPWEEESGKCFRSNLRAARLVGNKRKAYYLFADNHDLFLCHYQTAANDRDEIIQLCKSYKILFVIDESHYIKRFAGGVWAESLLQIAPYATRRVILSGTPMPNGYKDLWSQMTFLWPGKQLLGERNAYRTRCENVAQQEQIKYDIRPFFYRVKKSDLALPEPVVKKISYPLKPIQSQIYNALAARLITDLDLQPMDRIKLKGWRKAKMVRLLQAASNPSLLCQYSEEFELPALASDGTSLVELIEKYPLYELPAKFEAAINLARELISQGKKVLLWTTFVYNIQMIKVMLGDLKYFTIYGAVPRDENEDEYFNREKEIRDFRASRIPCLLIANPAACAESISLHDVCHDAIYLDRTFNCGQYVQSLDRIHRIGLDKNEVVTYYILTAEHTIDETIDRRIIAKFDSMLHVLEDDIPVGSLDIEGPNLEDLNEQDADFEATINDLGAIFS